MRTPSFSATLFASTLASTLLVSALAHADTAPPSNVAPILGNEQPKPLSNADAQSLLWPNAPLKSTGSGSSGISLGTSSKPLTQSDFANAASKQISFLASLRSWRDTFSGTGTQARRNIFQGKWFGSSVGLAFGNVAPPQISGLGGTGMVASFGPVEIGTTARPGEINKALASWDGLMTGTKPGLTDDKTQTWLRARPIQNKNVGLELDFSRAAMDIAPGAAEQWRKGIFYGGQGTFKLPMRWNLQSSWTAAKMDEGESDTKDAWQARMDGPLVHPLGEAKVALELKSTDPGYTTLNGSNANGEKVGSATVTQGIKTGNVEGELKFNASNRERGTSDNANTNDELESRVTTSGGNLRFKINPRLSLKAQGNVSTTRVERAGNDFSNTQAVNQEEVASRGGDLGMEWKVGKSLSVNASVGRSQISNWRAASSDSSGWDNLPGTGENRYSLSLRHPASGLAATYSTRERSQLGDADWQRLETIRLEAERDFFSAFKIKTILDFAHNPEGSWGDQSSLARHITTQVMFRGAARIDMNFRDGAGLPNAWRSTDIGGAFNDGYITGDRSFGAQFNAGSAAKGSGLGFSVGYNRDLRSGSNNEQWRVGITYK